MIQTHLAPSFHSTAWNEWIAALPEMCDAAGPEQHLEGGRNELIRFEHLGRQVVVKRFRNRGLWKKVAYRISSSKARRSFEHSQRILDAGLLTPTPIAWREDWENGFMKESYYVCEYLDFEHDAFALRDPKFPDRLQKADLLGKTIARLHNSDTAHLDLNSGNLLFTRSADSHWRIFIIDNNRMRFQFVSPDLACSLLLRTELEDEILEIALKSYAKQRSFAAEPFRSRYLKKRSRYQMDRKIRNATRPWRKKIGL